jgi:hypothetical protein
MNEPGVMYPDLTNVDLSIQGEIINLFYINAMYREEGNVILTENWFVIPSANLSEQVASFLDGQLRKVTRQHAAYAVKNWLPGRICEKLTEENNVKMCQQQLIWYQLKRKFQ